MIPRQRLLTISSCFHITVFNYSPAAHNVVVVDKQGYAACKAPEGAKEFRSGNDKITLVKGENYFICTFPGHCESKMKVAVNAEWQKYRACYQ